MFDLIVMLLVIGMGGTIIIQCTQIKNLKDFISYSEDWRKRQWRGE